MHFTAMSSNYESDNNVDGNNNDEGITDEEALTQNSSIDVTKLDTAHVGSYVVSDSECSSVMGGDPSMLEMIMIKDVSTGAEVRISCSVMWIFFKLPWISDHSCEVSQK